MLVINDDTSVCNSSDLLRTMNMLHDSVLK